MSGVSKQAGSNLEPAAIACRLQVSIGRVLSEIDGCSMRPTDIARTLDVSRVMVSRVLSAIRKPEPIDTLTQIPGPETLRSIVRGALDFGIHPDQIDEAMEAIDSFDWLIRDQFGTRSALNAALSGSSSQSRDKFDQASRYQVFKGMSQIVGAQSQLWLTSMMLTPSPRSDEAIDISTIHGACGLRRLRPDTPIRFVYGIPPEYEDRRQSPIRPESDISSFLAHTPAPLSVETEGGQIINTFAPEISGKDDLYDMLAEVFIPEGSSRFAQNGRQLRGTSVIPDVPVVTLISDVVLCGDVFNGIEPELFVYNTMARGGADVHDPKREVDRIPTHDTIQSMGGGIGCLEINDFPRYRDMVAYLCEKNRTDPASIRTYRLRVQYPVFGFQYTIAFRVPERGGSD